MRQCTENRTIAINNELWQRQIHTFTFTNGGNDKAPQAPRGVECGELVYFSIF